MLCGPRPSVLSLAAARSLREAQDLDGESTYCGDMRIVLEGDVVRAEELKRAKSAKEFLERVNNKLEMSLEDLASAKPLLVKTSAIVG